VRSRMRVSTDRRRGAGRDGFRVGRREVLTGSVGTGALLALPNLNLGSHPAAKRHAADSSGTFGQYTFVYGTPDLGKDLAGSLVAASYPAPKTASVVSAAAITMSPRTSIPVAVNLAATPVSSPDQAVTAVATVEMTRDGANVKLVLLDPATAKVARQGSVTLDGVPADANILVTPVFAPDSEIVCLVLAITKPVTRRPVHKVHPLTGKPMPRLATTWRSHHALAYFDQRTGAMTGPFHLDDEPSLALSTAAASSSELLLWTTREPQPGDPPAVRAQASLSRLSVFPLGSGKARLSVPAPAPWPGGEPVATLPSGDIARLVRGSGVQVCSVSTGDVTELTVAAFSQVRSRPSAVTMQIRPDGTAFLTKPGSGVAVIADPAEEFRTRAEIQFPPPASPLGAPWTKAVLSAEGETMYVLGPAGSGGLSAYEVSSGKLTASYTEGYHYYGLHQMPDGTLLAVQPQNPRLAFFAPDLSPLGVTDTDLYVSAIF